ncbi:MAG: heme exporter protein CcmD [Proteobacteria bacterium]|nr:heme exporter protein CcmD [Pseudomonadota bacterium]
MKWESLAAFIDMGGYGLYVWGSYGVALVCILVEIWLLARGPRLPELAGGDAR